MITLHNSLQLASVTMCTHIYHTCERTHVLIFHSVKSYITNSWCSAIDLLSCHRFGKRAMLGEVVMGAKNLCHADFSKTFLDMYDEG